MRKEDIMKWSELFASLLGERDTDVSQSQDSQESIQKSLPETSQQPITIPNIQQNTDALSQFNNSTQKTIGQNLTQEQFDALNSRIAELEQANRELTLRGSVTKQEVATPESLIYSLCVERNNNGKTDNSNSI